MNRKSRNIRPRSFSALLFVSIAIVVVTLATTGFSSSALQRNGNLQITQFYHVAITGDDMRNLPSGENRIDAEIEVGKHTNRPAGHVIFRVTRASMNTSVDLIKTGSGTLILPNANNSGLTKMGPGTLVLSGTTAAVDEKLALSGSGIGVVYEFRDLSSEDFDRIFMPGGENLKSYLQHHRPSGAMKAWNFKLLLIGPAEGVAQASGWWKSKPIVTMHSVSCSAGFCSCSDFENCRKLADSGSCSSSMNCDGDGNCYCTAK